MGRMYSAAPHLSHTAYGDGAGNVKPNLSVFNGLVSHVLTNARSSSSPTRYSLGAGAAALPPDESPVSGVSSDATAREQEVGRREGEGGYTAKTHPWVSITQPSLGSRVDLINKST